MGNVSISAALIKALSADSESHFFFFFSSKIEVHNSSFE